MTLEEEIVEWGSSRPAWQRDALRRLAQGEILSGVDYGVIAESLVNGDDSNFGPFTVADMPGGAATGQQVSLSRLTQVDHVNALVADQSIAFAADGLTVIYGDNASGKSGYARLLKRMVRSRHREDVLTDVFADSATLDPSARVDLCVDGASQSHAWPATGSAELRRVTFFDEACGDAYIAHESEVTFRPAPIFVLEGLIQACDGVRVHLDRLVTDNTARSRRLPVVPEGTSAATFIASLSGRTTSEEVDSNSVTPEDVDDQVQKLSEEELRLRATDPTHERSRLQTLAGRFDRVKRHFEGLGLVYGTEALEQLAIERDLATQLRAAATVAAAHSFDSEPLPGVGTQTWRALWEAARSFAQAEVDHEHAFPVDADGSRCVLCQQELGDEARDRFRRFEAAVRDQTERQATEAERNHRDSVQRIVDFVVSPPDLEVVLDDLAEHDEALVATCRAALTIFEQLREHALKPSEHPKPEAAPNAPVAVLTARSAETTAAAENTDSAGFTQRLEEVAAQRAELEARRILQGAKDDITAEVERRRDRARLDELKRLTDTTGITRKATELTRAHVTSIVRDRFTRESDRLNLEKVTLEDTGGQKGQLHHRPAFVGAVQKVTMEQVLSEGEQTALGLAGYFTEAFLDESRSAMVLDDPVCSLDHIRRRHVAARLTDFAMDRQVIVFTHDLAFVSELRRAADHAGVGLTERAIERRGGKPGVCVDVHPWKAKDAKARLAQLDTELANIRAIHTSSSQDDYERATTDWAGKLSETWERIVSLEVVGKVSDLTTLEVRPKMFRLLAAITHDDDKELQESYGRCSLWARRHDKSVQLNYSAPTVDEMTTELALVRAWVDRIRKYTN